MDLIDFNQNSLTNKIHVMDIAMDDSGLLACRPLGKDHSAVVEYRATGGQPVNFTQWTHVVCSFTEKTSVLGIAF